MESGKFQEDERQNWEPGGKKNDVWEAMNEYFEDLNNVDA